MFFVAGIVDVHQIFVGAALARQFPVAKRGAVEILHRAFQQVVAVAGFVVMTREVRRLSSFGCAEPLLDERGDALE